jgi:hypothetical protein
MIMIMFDSLPIWYGWCGMAASILSGILLIIGLNAVNNPSANEK